MSRRPREDRPREDRPREDRLARIINSVEGVPIDVETEGVPIDVETDEEIVGWYSLPTDLRRIIFDIVNKTSLFALMRELSSGKRSLRCFAHILAENADQDPDTFMIFRLSMKVPTSVLPIGGPITQSLLYGDVEMEAEFRTSFAQSLQLINRNDENARNGIFGDPDRIGSFGEFKSMDVSIQPSGNENVFVVRIKTQIPVAGTLHYIPHPIPLARNEQMKPITKLFMKTFMPAVVNRSIGRRCYAFLTTLYAGRTARIENWFPQYRPNIDISDGFEYTGVLWNTGDCPSVKR
jgi:hypothetical protein